MRGKSNIEEREGREWRYKGQFFLRRKRKNGMQEERKQGKRIKEKEERREGRREE